MTAPWPPGSLQNPPAASQLLGYLDALGTWVSDRHDDLDRLDGQIQRRGGTPGATDMATTLTIWQAIKDRYEDLLRVWDSGRVIEADLTKLAGMIWSPLNDMLTPGTTLSTGAGLAISLPESCRLLEALLAQLSAAYELAPQPTELTRRLRDLRAQVARITDQAALDPPDIAATTNPTVEALTADVAAAIASSERGADIGGLLGPLEIRAARLERDLIVGHAQRAGAAELRIALVAQRQALVDKGAALTALVSQVCAAVAPAPKYAVPQMAVLGDVPDDPAGLAAYQDKLAQVAAAYDVVDKANRAALAAKVALQHRIDAATATPHAPTSVAAGLGTQIEALMATSPTPMPVVTPLVEAYERAMGLPS